MNLSHSTSFVVMPSDCNYLSPMIFGGAFMAQLDLCAAVAANRLLHDSKQATHAVTHKAEFTFHAAAELVDIVFMDAEIVELRSKAIVVKVRAERERRDSPKRDWVASAKFVFVSKNQGGFMPHGLEMPVRGELRSL